MSDIDFHDAKVIGIKFNDTDDSLILNVSSENGVHYILEFKQVYDWVLTSFENQNVIFAIEEYISSPTWLLEEYNVMHCIPDGIYTFFINSSVGMSGIVFSKGMVLSKV